MTRPAEDRIPNTCNSKGVRQEALPPPNNIRPSVDPIDVIAVSGVIPGGHAVELKYTDLSGVIGVSTMSSKSQAARSPRLASRYLRKLQSLKIATMECPRKRGWLTDRFVLKKPASYRSRPPRLEP
jgi:hypothetical protein